MIASYLCAIGVVGIGLSLVATKNFLGRTRKFHRYTNPVSFLDKVCKTYLYYGFPIVALLGCSGAGMLAADYVTKSSHYISLRESSPDYANYYYVLKFYLLAPLGVACFNLFATLTPAQFDYEQGGGPSTGICAHVSFLFGAILTEGLMIWRTTHRSTYEDPEISSISLGLALCGPISFMSLLVGRVFFND
jgi:hypothetical protein